MIDWDALATVTEGFITELLGWVYVPDPETDSGEDSDWENVSPDGTEDTVTV